MLMLQKQQVCRCLTRSSATPTTPRPIGVQQRLARLRCRATEEPQPPKPEASQQPKVEAPPQSATQPPQQTDKPLILQSGQGTAIVTGSISIIFGVAYLALVFLMDWRGGEMLPPPPEAYGP